VRAFALPSASLEKWVSGSYSELNILEVAFAA